MRESVKCRSGAGQQCTHARTRPPPQTHIMQALTWVRHLSSSWPADELNLAFLRSICLYGAQQLTVAQQEAPVPELCRQRQGEIMSVRLFSWKVKNAAVGRQGAAGAGTKTVGKDRVKVCSGK
eukprot:1133621-Pelagomonas_calceolata.AAC.9